jgi:hypothetical protein
VWSGCAKLSLAINRPASRNELKHCIVSLSYEGCQLFYDSSPIAFVLSRRMRSIYLGSPYQLIPQALCLPSHSTPQLSSKSYYDRFLAACNVAAWAVAYLAPQYVARFSSIILRPRLWKVKARDEIKEEPLLSHSRTFFNCLAQDHMFTEPT